MPSDFPDPLDRPADLPLGNPDDLISQLAGEEIARLLAPDANWQPEPQPPAGVAAAGAAELKPSPPRANETPVEELAAQLDQLFEEIRQATPPVPPPTAAPAAAAAKPKPKPSRRATATPRPPVAERVEAPTFEPYRPPAQPDSEPPIAHAHFIDAEPVLVMRRRADEVEETIREEPRQTLIAPLEEDPLPPALRPLAWLNAPVADAGPRVRLLASVVSLLSFAASVSALVYVIVLRQQQM
jgi:hypothetical protein